jgi:hypothetical protein
MINKVTAQKQHAFRFQNYSNLSLTEYLFQHQS